MCKNVEAVLEEKTEMPIRCEVQMDGQGYVSDDFVCIMVQENGDTSLFYNTDALTLGMGMKMIARAFVESMNNLSDEERDMVTRILGNQFDTDAEDIKEIAE